MLNLYDSNSVLTNVTFSGNFAELGGGIYIGEGSSLVLTNASLYFNSAWYGGGMAIFNSSLVLTNGILWGNTATYTPDIYNGASTLTVTNTCTQTTITGTGNVQLATDPFVTAASGETFLDQSSLCVNAGSEAATNDATYGFAALGLPDWWNMTTNIDGTLDANGGGANDVDMGRHYDPNHVWIATLLAGPTNITWTTNAAASCEITNDNDDSVISVAAGELAAGSVAHGQSAGVTLSMTCPGSVGLPASAEAVVP